MPIGAKDANALVKRFHYSGKVDPRSQLHLGVFLDGKCGGVMQFGPSVNKRASSGLVEGSSWNEFIELNRMAFSDWLPRNSESRAIGYAFRWMRKEYPHLKWCVSYADGTQCGDGAIYRASGFVLTDIKKNASMWKMPDGEVCCSIVFNPGFSPNAGKASIKAKYGKTGSGASTAFLNSIGAEKIPGFQLRYIYFLDPEARKRLTVPVLPFSEIQRRGAGMYRGKPSAGSIAGDATGFQSEEGGSIPTPALNVNP